MTDFLILLGIVLLIVAAVQVVRILELTSALKGGKEDSDEVFTDSENRFNGTLLAVFVLAFMGFVVWLTVKYWPFLLPDSAAEHGVEIDTMLSVNFYIVTFVFIICNLVLFFIGYMYYGKKGRVAEYQTHNNKVEIIWTVVPTIVLAGLIIYGLRVWSDTMGDHNYAEKGTLKIELYAKQFDWTARYAGEDNKLGDAYFRDVQGVNALGLDSADSKSWDDKLVKGTMHIPKGRRIHLSFRSQDVIHSAYLPHFRVQMNCVPGMVTQFSFVPTHTTEEMRNTDFVIRKYAKINEIRKNKNKKPVEFDYVLLCNKVCGKSHNYMQMKVIVDTPEDYEVWYEKQKRFMDKEAPKTVEANNNTDK